MESINLTLKACQGKPTRVSEQLTKLSSSLQANKDDAQTRHDLLEVCKYALTDSYKVQINNVSRSWKEQSEGKPRPSAISTYEQIVSASILLSDTSLMTQVVTKSKCLPPKSMAEFAETVARAEPIDQANWYQFLFT